MLSNYLKIALRNIRKQKLYSFINILGLTIGIIGSIFVLLYVVDELSYDKFNKDADRIYRVNLAAKVAGQEIDVIATCPPLAATMVSEFPEVESATRLGQNAETLIRNGDMVFAEPDVVNADSNFFSFFSYKLLEGDPKTCLSEPNSIVITEDLVKKYFGNENALGKILVIGNDNQSYKVTGIAKNPPHNSHFSFNALLTNVAVPKFESVIWLNNNLVTYYKIKKGANNANIDNKFSDLVVKYIGPEVQKFMGISLEQFKSGGGEYGFYSQPLTEIHLKSHRAFELGVNGDIIYVYLFSAIGIFILIIACINFMNLSTAKSAGRAKEVGLRKTLGSWRSQLIGQFLMEAIIYSLIATTFGLIMVYFLLPFFNSISGKELQFNEILNPVILITVVGIIFFAGILAGSYPAFYLTSFKITETLKGRMKAGIKSGKVRSVLVVFQFAISIILIICTTIVYQQLTYSQNKNLGFDRRNIVVIRNAAPLGNDMIPFKNDLLTQKGIVDASFSNNVIPGTINTTVFRTKGNDTDHIMTIYNADYDHLKTFGFQLDAGRYFSRDFPADSSAIILNEAAVKEFDLTDPIGAEIEYTGQNKIFKVVGVLKDFNYESLRNKVGPLAITLTQSANLIAIKYTGNPREVVNLLQSEWKKYATNDPLDYYFLDEKFDALFHSEQQLGQLFSVFTGLAIFIACLGLFGLASFMAEQRTKEIGIRKTMGASTFTLIRLLSNEFTRLVLIAFGISIFPAWYFMGGWLDNFAFRIQMNPAVYILAGFGALLLAWITVGYQSVKAARSNPVKSLRYE